MADARTIEHPAVATPGVHATALVDPQASIDPSAEIGPLCLVRGPVTIGPGTRLVARVHVEGPVSIGAGCTLFPGVCVGTAPQDFKHTPGMPTAGVRIGDRTVVREHCTIHAATKPDAPTSVGSGCFLMVNSHVGHDAIVDDDAILTNNAMLAGHTHVMAKAVVSGGVAVHQFCRIGRLAMVGGGSVMTRDVPHFCVAFGRNTMAGLNIVGLRRNGFERRQIDALRHAYNQGFRAGLDRRALLELFDGVGRESPLVAEWAQFVRTTKRTIALHATPRSESDAEAAGR